MEPLLNLRNLLEHEIEDLYSAEEQIIEALPSMVEKTKAPELKKALNEHLRITREHKKRLDKVKEIFRKDNNDETESKSLLERIFGNGTKCKGMEGLIKEGEKMMQEDMDPQVKDAAIIASAQKVEHYEISGYGTARAYATELNLWEIVTLLQSTLNEEYAADDLLTALALKKVNIEAIGKQIKNSRANSSNNNGQKRTGNNLDKSKQKRSAPKKSVARKSASKKSPSKRVTSKRSVKR